MKRAAVGWVQCIAAAVVLQTDLAQGAAPPSYLCVAELSTGVRWNGNNWETSTFYTEKEKFVVRYVEGHGQDPTPYNYEVVRLGDEAPIHLCTRLKVEDDFVDGVTCGGLLHNFIMWSSTLRFQSFYGIGYLAGDAPGNTPAITVGKCSKI